MCLHTLHFFTFPPSWKEGGQGDGPRPYRGQSPEPREPSGVWRRGPALRWRWWCPQCMKRGVQRGAPPLAGGMEDVPPYTTIPLPGRKGARGMVLRCVQAGSPEGSTPTGRRYGGCAPYTTLLHFFLEGRGPGGWSAPLSRPEPREPTACGVAQHYGGGVVPPVHEAGSPAGRGSTPTGRLHGIPRYNEGGVTCLRPPTFQEHKELFL